MHFFKPTVAVLALLAAPAFGALTAQQMAVNLQALTQKFLALQTPAEEIDLYSFVSAPFRTGPIPQVLDGFEENTALATTNNIQVQGSGLVKSEADAQLLVDVFKIYVKVQIELLNILIERGGFNHAFPFIRRVIANTLREFESVNEILMFNLVDFTSPFPNDIAKDAASLSGALKRCIETYSRGTTRTSLAKRDYAREISV